MLTYTSQQQLNSVNYQDLSVLPIVIKRDGSKRSLMLNLF